MSRELPNGWIAVPLTQVATPCMGETILAKDLNEAGIPVYSAGRENKPWGFLENPRRIFGPETVVLSARGSIGFPKIPTEKAFTSTQTTIALRFPSKALAQFGCYWLNSIDWVGMTSGCSIPMLTVGEISNLEMPVPPSNEQRRIVAKLEALLAKVDASRKRLERIPVILKRFRQAVLAAACDGRLTEDWRIKGGKTQAEWKTTPLEDICESISDGDHQPPPKAPSGIPFLTIGNIASGKLNFDATRFVPKEYFQQIKNHRVPKPGDVLFSVVATIGIPALVDTDRPFCFQRHIALLRPSKEITSRFLLALMGSRAVVQECQALATGTAQPTLSLGNLRGIRVDIPPLDEQEEIAQRVQSLAFVADQIEARYAKAKAQVDRLTQSILAKAFRGELVPQDPNDEPADLLLSRLAVTPSESSAPARRRGRPPRVQPAAPPVVTAAPAEVKEAEAPALADLTPEAILQAHREVLASIPSPLSEDNLLRAVAQRLGYQRLGARVRARLLEILSTSIF